MFKINDIKMSRFLDSSGEIEIEIMDGFDWINKDIAVAIIEHLTRVFELGEE